MEKEKEVAERQIRYEHAAHKDIEELRIKLTCREVAAKLPQASTASTRRVCSSTPKVRQVLDQM